MAKVHIVESGQLINGKFSFCLREAYSSYKKACEVVKKELIINQASEIEEELYKLSNVLETSTTYTWHTPKGKAVRQRTIIKTINVI